MRVQFAINHEEHLAGSFADVPVEMGRALIQSGKAKEAPVLKEPKKLEVVKPVEIIPRAKPQAKQKSKLFKGK